MGDPASRSHDVIIVGAGPAGATLAGELSRQGLDVLILEKEILPRYKACAGGITVKTAGLLGLDLGPVTRDTVLGARVACGGRRPFTRSYPKPMIHMVMRDEFDHMLTQRAREAGAVLLENERVRRVRMPGEGVAVETANGTFTGRIVVGADGARSVVAASAGLAREMAGSFPRGTTCPWVREAPCGRPGGSSPAIRRCSRLTVSRTARRRGSEATGCRCAARGWRSIPGDACSSGMRPGWSIRSPGRAYTMP
jgi:2-polyprenyl-6-methoxyphenol hydroxylase-like FAD-dependent oxidoreductase